MLYTLVGLPGAGKSTFAKKHPDCVVVSSDAVRKELFGDEAIQKNPNKVFEIVYARIEKALAEGKDVIFDAANVESRWRKAIPQKYNTYNVAVWINTPIDECIRRNNARDRVVPIEVIKRMNRQFTPPTLSEGFDQIMVIQDDKIIKLQIKEAENL